jgi:hypothetical protein
VKKSTVLVALGCASQLFAGQMTAPLFEGVASHDFDPPLRSQWRVATDVHGYMRSAHRSFGAHGFSTQELPAIIFNKESFRLSNAFEDCLVPHNTQHYNPFMRIITIAPRAQYKEQGAVVSIGAERSVFKGKARWGVRAKLPIKSVEWERLDQGGRRDSQTEDVIKWQKNENTQSTIGFGYRLDFLEAMPTKDFRQSQVEYDATGGGNTFIRMFGGDTRGVDTVRNSGAIYSPEGYTPRGSRVGVLASGVSTTQLPSSLDNLSADTVYFLGNSDSYPNLSDEAARDVATRVANQDKKATVWVVSTHAGDGSLIEASATQAISTEMKDLLPTYNANCYEWFHDQGYDLASSREMGIGDLDLELYYEHILSDRAVAHLGFVASLPTSYGTAGMENDFSKNPYQARLGNGHHVELGGSVGFDIEALSWLAIHLDGQYRFALDRSETICGTPQGSLIKNMGPGIKADVHWSSFVSNLDFQWCHPHTTDVTGYFGYQFYYKAADTVRYSASTMESWLGKTYDSTLGVRDYTVDNPMTLDNALASAGTEQLAHRVKAGLSYHFSDWLSVSAGGALTIAGQNMPRELDWNCSCRIVM